VAWPFLDPDWASYFLVPVTDTSLLDAEAAAAAIKTEKRASSRIAILVR
jgi:hypothetical protein